MAGIKLDEELLKLAMEQSFVGPDDIDTPIQAWLEMNERWKLLRALRSGTYGMRAEGVEYLPQEPRESDVAYDVRLSRSFLFPAYNDTVRRLAKKPFSKPVEVGDDREEMIVAPLLPYLGDIDQEGSSLSLFSQEVFEMGLDRGMAHILVEYPKAEPGESRADEMRAGRRPFFCLIAPDNVIGWRHEMLNGKWVLTQLRIKEVEWVPAGRFSEERIERVRLFQREIRSSDQFPSGFTVFRVFERRSGEEYAQVDQGYISINEIPLVTYYTNKRGRMTAEPPLCDLAEKNLEHWQSSSDQRNVLRFVRTGILFGTGITGDDIGFGKDADDSDKRAVLEIGANRMLLAQEPQAKLNWVEHTGRGIGAGRQDLKDIEEHMMLLGLRPLIEKSTGTPSTATEASIKTAQESTDMKAWAKELGRALGRCFQLALKYMGKEQADPIPVSVFSDFAVEFSKAQDAQALMALRAGGDITREQLLVHLKRIGLLDDSFNVEHELVEIATEERERLGNELTLEDMSTPEREFQNMSREQPGPMGPREALEKQ